MDARSSMITNSGDLRTADQLRKKVCPSSYLEGQTFFALPARRAEERERAGKGLTAMSIRE
jgi:hypothetical protein